jgi:hypothetical protein
MSVCEETHRPGCIELIDSNVTTSATSEELFRPVSATGSSRARVELTAVVTAELRLRPRSEQLCNSFARLLTEVHTFGAGGQAALAELVGARHDGQFRETRRIISTSSVSLFERVREGVFDEDLFYRLNVIHITT